MILWLMIGIGLLLFAVMAWDAGRWRRIESDAGGAKWRRGEVTRVDENRDGVIDEISRQVGENHWVVSRDTDGDGWLDLEYDLTNGIATRMRPIKVPAPGARR
jgi:hypothetical protein